MREFKAESKKLLEMMINSIYTNKDIFLRELISNASDALDKRYIKDLENNPSDFDRADYKIEILANKENRTLTIRDTGIGMDEEELDRNLGTIAHSGSLEFKQQEKEGENPANIIGQFGVGFYSAFMVAEKIEVLSRPYGSDKAYIWESEGSGGYSIKTINKENLGTDIILYLRENEDQENYDKYLEEYELRRLVEQYSNYIRYPIQMDVKRNKRVELKEDATDEEKEKDKENPQYEEVIETITLNSMTPIWEKNRNELKDGDYVNFYQQEHLGYEEPIDWAHMVADGTLSYRAILYIPKRLPWDFYTRDFKKGLSLYSRGVKIMDHAQALIPDYYSFAQGVVSSEDFRLNLSRETLQEDRVILAIGKKIENKITDMIKKMMKNEPEKYENFFKTFGNILKGGIYQTYGGKKDQLAPLLIFQTSKGKNRNLDDIVDEMEKTKDKETSEDNKEKEPIYYISGTSLEQLDKMPGIEGLKEDGIEILYLTESVDEFTLKAMGDYRGHDFKSVQSEDFNSNEDIEKEETQEEFTDIFESIREMFVDELFEVKSGIRLKNDAAILVSKGDVSIEMEKAFAEQEGLTGMLKAQKVLELNLDHPAVKKMIAYKNEGKEEGFKKYASLLYDQARLIAGLPIKDPIEFSRTIQELM